PSAAPATSAHATVGGRRGALLSDCARGAVRGRLARQPHRSRAGGMQNSPSKVRQPLPAVERLTLVVGLLFCTVTLVFFAISRDSFALAAQAPADFLATFREHAHV